MNTRIQVEHPVTEMITGIDLVREMIRVCGGEPLRYAQKDVAMKGHAIEVRINAEDPAKNFQPAPGTVTSLRTPGGPGTRFDTMLYQGYQVPPFYDSLLGKLIVWDENARRRHQPHGAGAWPNLKWAASTPRNPCINCWRRTPKSAPPNSTPAGSSPGSNRMGTG